MFRSACRLWVVILPVALSAIMLGLSPRSAVAAAPAAGPTHPIIKPIQWSTNFQVAALTAQKENKLLLVYFSGSDWDEYGKKLEKEVLHTPIFVEWVNKNVIPVQIDYPKERELRGSAKHQAEEMRIVYNIAKVPTFLFIDTSGEVIGRCGYDTFKLRDNEPKDSPKSCLEYCEAVLKSRPPPEKLVIQPTLREGYLAARKHGLPLLIMITQKPTDAMLHERDLLLANQQFVRFVNRNMAFTLVNWPEDYDKSPDAEYARQFAVKWQFGAGPLKLVLWDPGGLGSLKTQINSISSQWTASLIKQLQALLPKIDYNGGWIEDFKLARAIAAQQKKDLFISFVSSNGSEWSKKIDAEVYQTKEFRTYAHDNLVLLKIDFPKTIGAAAPNVLGEAAAAPTTQLSQSVNQKSPAELQEEMSTGKSGEQPKQLKEQNKMLADLYGIRGYPTIVILNNLGQKIGDAKYMKGGVSIFLRELDALRKKDHDRRTLISEEEAAK